jgi:hypothetical protein
MRTVTVTISDDQEDALTALIAFENANITKFNEQVEQHAVDAEVLGGVELAADIRAQLAPLDTLEQLVQSRLDERLAKDLEWFERVQIDQVVELVQALPTKEARDAAKAQILAIAKGAK